MAVSFHRTGVGVESKARLREVLVGDRGGATGSHTGAAAQHPLAIAVGGLIALAAAMGIGRFVYTPILPFMVDALGLSGSAAGLIAAANFLGYLLGALVAAWPGLPGGRRGWFLAAVAVSGLTTAAMGAADTLPGFLLLRFAGGVASAVTLVFASTLVLDRLALAGRGGLASVHFAGVGTGVAVSALLVAGLAAGGAGWRELWLASGGLSLLALGAVARLVPGAPDGPRARPAAPAAGDGRRLARLIAAYGLFGFGYVVTATFVSAMVRGTPALQPVEPVVWLVFGVAAIPSVALWVGLGRAIGVARAFALACLVEAAGVAATVLVVDGVAVVLGAALLGGTFMGLTALGLMLARDMAAGDPRRDIGLMTASFGLGQMIGPAWAGYALELTGSLTLPTLTAAAALLAAAALVPGRRAAPGGA
jgi:MFS family permease